MNFTRRAQQSEKIKTFVGFTNTSERVARETLEAFNWNVQLAVDGYFGHSFSSKDNGAHHSVPINYQELSDVFEGYKGGLFVSS
ncbi:hypothetical protein K493DRAFT_26231 [Basidiobolus meristosporus CBS 931.73]|uniref:Uncharacterized protein n=1 Tax=Basidiobolus meristosporus CBS 931.73 TaxID=1314790 RepID=A0A1Y1YB71_9FUNG|nr:hypothetical protein K493DRAFT_26231 [Basidiobolus meristosporus CBS 931.73]|eukprot:ORX95183.1 hypothetical protein K493DRAFT_26231 [Basidiobolus meristosporus CBS 931.73]